ncbi:MAG: isoprenyl transferase [Gammaproteobacteria bacterium]|nr:isoprenyl transferase [Gammaproteobacteria bacterium]
MDGNGRWAENRFRPRLFGHKAGVDSVRECVETCRELGVKSLTLYAFSTENWNRPSGEVSGLMGLLKTYLRGELKNLLSNDIRLRCFGAAERLPLEVRSLLEETIERTAGCLTMNLNLALNYGGRIEIIGAVQKIADQCSKGELAVEDISEQLFSDSLYTAGQNDPDLLIRTGGEHRLSNFLLWQASYAELYFTDTFWPDFRKEKLYEAIKVYNSRQRRFGRTGAQVRTEEQQ